MEHTARPVSRIPWRAIKRTVLGVAVALFAFTAFMGFLHTKAGRPLMAKLGFGCPVGKVTPAQAVASREATLTKLRGAEVAPSRPALGFSLDTSSESDVRAWAQKLGVTCTDETRGFKLVRCADVPPTALGNDPSDPKADTVSFAFSPKDSLISVDVMRTNVLPETASRLYTTIASKLAGELGPATIVAGDSHATYLRAQLMRTATTGYQFRDYLVTLTAMNLGTRGGIAVREQYGSGAAPQM